MTSLYKITLLVLSIVSLLEISLAFHRKSINNDASVRHSCKRNLAMKLEYRNAKESDIPSISELCSESFDGPFQWHQQIQKLQSIDAFRVQLKDRLTNLVAKGVKHTMIVAIDNEQPEKYAVVGFLEVGLLPSPIGMKETVIIRDDVISDVVSAVALGDSPDIETEVASNLSLEEDNTAFSNPAEGITSDIDPLRVTSQPIEQLVTSMDVPLSVNTVENSAEISAVSSYETLGINSISATDSPVYNPDSPYGTVDPNQLVIAAAALEAEQKLRKKKEEVPYLGNVAVSKDCRRQGVGMKLVKIGLKVAQKWGDPKLFVVVESDNYGAIKMYEKLQFVCVMKEEDNINRRMDRLPRIFMAIDVPVAKPKVEIISSKESLI